MLFDYLTSDALLGKFFEPFIFENVPALDLNPTDVFLNEVESCDIYLGIFGQDYGFEDKDGISPTEREFDTATVIDKIRLVYVKQAQERHPKEELLIRKVEKTIVRRSFAASEQLKTAVYASLINYLIENEIIRTTPFDAALNSEAAIEDLSEEKIHKFAGVANRKRAFPFTETSGIKDILTHLNLIKGERVTNAALLLFGLRPQRFFITSEVKCAHFHGLNVSKPIPSYQVYKGNVFEMIESAVDFVLSKINLYVGDRSKNISVDVEYEIPKQAVTEAIVNAIAHRDYTSNASVQVMLFADRLEVTNPGKLPYELTIDELYTPHRSIPANPLIAEAMYLNGTIERMGTGTQELAESCVEKGLKKPDFIQKHDFMTVLYRSTTENLGKNGCDVPENVEKVTENALDVTEKVLEKDGKMSEKAVEMPEKSSEMSEKTVEMSEKNIGMSEKSMKMSEKLLNIIKDNPSITIEELSLIEQKTTRTIERNLRFLKSKGLIERIGPDKGGHWRVIG